MHAQGEKQGLNASEENPDLAVAFQLSQFFFTQVVDFVGQSLLSDLRGPYLPVNDLDSLFHRLFDGFETFVLTEQLLQDQKLIYNLSFFSGGNWPEELTKVGLEKLLRVHRVDFVHHLE